MFVVHSAMNYIFLSIKIHRLLLIQMSIGLGVLIPGVLLLDFASFSNPISFFGPPRNNPLFPNPILRPNIVSWLWHLPKLSGSVDFFVIWNASYHAQSSYIVTTSVQPTLSPSLFSMLTLNTLNLIIIFFRRNCNVASCPCFIFSLISN